MAKPVSKSERVKLFFSRLSAAPPAHSADEAFELLVQTLNQVEEEYSGVPNMDEPPPQWIGRMFPPRADNIVRHDDGSLSIRTRGNRITIARDGSIRIVDLAGKLILDKPGDS